MYILASMNYRRKFLKLSAITSLGLVTQTSCQGIPDEKDISKKVAKGPVVISTWAHGVPANAKAMEVLAKGGTALDAVEAGVMIAESDPAISSVGVGGSPDREGIITLDACIMDEKSRCGSVAFLQNIEHPIAVARKVMEDTPHVMLAGKGAYEFARAKGFPHKNLATESSDAAYKDWQIKSKYKPIINIENHDTISMLALDKNGNISGSCTTSGMAYKMHGRVGDSPIIGAGLFLDNEVGGAAATGVGEAIIRVAGSAMVVEAMRYGMSPQDACEEVVKRIIAKHPDVKDLQAGFIAMNKAGEVGAYAIYNGFNYAHNTNEFERLVDSPYKFEWD